MTEYGNDELEQASRNWIADTRDARDRARDILQRLDPAVSSDAVVDVPQGVVMLHAATLDYYRHLRPKRRQLKTTPSGEDLWNKEICELEIPPPTAQYHAGRRDWYGEFVTHDVRPIHQIPWRTVTLTLDGLEEQWGRNNHCDLYIRGEVNGQTQTVDVQRHTYHLSREASAAVLSQLNDCMNTLGWLPDASTIDDESGEMNPVMGGGW